MATFVKAVNAAANIASEQANVGGYSDEVWQRHQNTGESLQTIQQQMDESANYTEFINKIDKDIKTKQAAIIKSQKNIALMITKPNIETINLEKNKPGASNTFISETINDNNRKMKTSASELVRTQNELKQLQSQRENRVKSYEQRMRNISAQELQSKNLELQMRGISISNLSGGGSNISGSNIDTVGSVGSVENVNDTIDITSEDLHYMRELAEREAINQFTQQTLAPQITVTFGDVKVKEEADARIIADKIADIVHEQMNVSSNIVPAT